MKKQKKIIQIKDIKNIEKLYIKDIPKIYFLLKNKEVVYVGRTENKWPGRILAHLKENKKDFDEVYSINVEKKNIDKIEKYYIKKYKPKYNKTYKKL